MALKFKESFWDFRDDGFGLFYVTFSLGKREYRWYPKWKEIDEIFSSAYSTECSNKGKLKPLFGLIILPIIIDYFFNSEDFTHNSTLFKAIQEVKESLMNSPPLTIPSFKEKNGKE